MRRWRSLLAACALAASAVTACGGKPAPPLGTLAWTPCGSGRGPSGVLCATLQVPAGTATGGGPSVGIALDRLPATGRRTGVVVVNPGGPGVSAVDAMPAIAAGLGPGVREHLDVIGYDPPGVGHSDPVTCYGPARLAAYLDADPAPPGPSGFSEVVATARAFATACEHTSGPLLGHVSTLDAARDLERVRVALGVARLDYLGFSYGTLLGATYASLYPRNVGAMVLDGALDPAVPPLRELAVQAAALDGQFRAFARRCGSQRDCPWHPGADPTGAFEALLARVRSSPLAAAKGRHAGPAELIYGTAAGLYTTSGWPSLARALGEAEAGDGSGLVALYDRYMGRRADGTYDTTIESEIAVNCTDAPAPPLGEIAAAATAAAASAPVFGAANLDGEATCAVWPAPPAGPVGPLHAPGAPPIVVVGSTGDPITPYQWSVDLASELGSGVLLTRVGDGHTAYGASACVRRLVDAYFAGGSPPAPGTRCPSG